MNRIATTVVAALSLGACMHQPDGAEPSEQARAGAEAGARVEVATHSEHGRHLTDAEGRALYMFEQDPANRSVCYGACAEEWPPYVSEGMPVAAAGADAALLGRIQRQDGTWQVTYDRKPLYYYEDDTRPGDVRGQAVHDEWGGWYLVAPSGEAIDHDEHETTRL